MMHQKILIITPNNDTFTNPTMIALFQLLKEKETITYLFGPEQHPSCPENLFGVKHIQSSFKLSFFRNPKYYISQFLSYYKIFRCLKRNKINTLLAVDPMGLIVGGRVKRFLGKHLHLSYLSFEIFFKEELSGYYLSLKNKEIYYSRYIDSLLIQDEKRKKMLFQENNIDLKEENVALVPVSPTKINISEKLNIHEKLGISKDKKLAVYSGSVGKWCGTEAIIDIFNKGYWDDNYNLVFHTRKPIKQGDAYYDELMQLHNNKSIPFTLHPNPFGTFEELLAFLAGFDIAFALYYPNSDNPYYGMNMKEIGLSSGKFSTYMMVGLPTIVTPCSIYEELLKKYQFGAILKDIKDAIKKIESQQNEAKKLYLEILNPTLKVSNYIDIIF